MCGPLRLLGLTLIASCGYLLTRDFVLFSEASLWFVGSSAGLGMFAFLASWWPNKKKGQQNRKQVFVEE